jgi:hypothetical protein
LKVPPKLASFFKVIVDGYFAKHVRPKIESLYKAEGRLP